MGGGGGGKAGRVRMLLPEEHSDGGKVIDVLVKVPDAAALAGFSQLGFYPVSIQVSESVFRVGFPNSET